MHQLETTMSLHASLYASLSSSAAHYRRPYRATCSHNVPQLCCQVSCWLSGIYRGAALLDIRCYCLVSGTAALRHASSCLLNSVPTVHCHLTVLLPSRSFCPGVIVCLPTCKCWRAACSVRGCTSWAHHPAHRRWHSTCRWVAEARPIGNACARRAGQAVPPVIKVTMQMCLNE